MNRGTEKLRLAFCSTRARKIYARIRDGYWYRRKSDGTTTDALNELLQAGLIREFGRVNVISTAFVPHDAKPFKLEMWKGRRL